MAIVILLPIILIVAFIIKIQDFGPIFFLQSRLGYKEQLFTIYKFRSMPINTPNVSSDKAQLIKITPFGKIIRRTNIDELPQLFNILKGDMSIVGPRPSLLNQEELIKLRAENDIYNCRPGLTGWAQVNSYDFMPISEKVRLDGYYKQNVSLKLDIIIIFRTIIYLFKKPPTY